MEAKDKANELIWNFSLEVDNIFTAEKCALISVNEVIKVFHFINPNSDDLILMEELNYWKDVKEHIKGFKKISDAEYSKLRKVLYP